PLPALPSPPSPPPVPRFQPPTRNLFSPHQRLRPERRPNDVTCQGWYAGYTMTDVHELPAEPARDAELFTEFANTLHIHDDGPDDIGDAASLRSWLAAHGLLRETRALHAVGDALPAFQDLRSLVHDVTERLVEAGRPSAAQVRRLNDV